MTPTEPGEQGYAACFSSVQTQSQGSGFLEVDFSSTSKHFASHWGLPHP